MPIEFRARKAWHQRPRVEDHHLLLAATWIQVVDELRHSLLAGPALAGDQHRGIGEPSDLDGVPEDPPPGWALTYQALADVAAIDELVDRLPAAQALRNMPCRGIGPLDH